MYKIFCILSFLIVCISCKKEIKNYNSSEIIRSNLDSINKAKSIHEKNDPIVSHEYKELLAKRVNHFINDTILQEFASKLKKTKHRDSNGNELVLEKYPKNIFHLNTSDSIFNDKLGKLSFDLPNEIYLQKGDSFRISKHKIYNL